MFIDTHAHIYVDQFNNDFVEVINRALEQNVRQILMPNIDLSSIEDVFKIAEQYPNICRPMLGLHPCSVDEDWLRILSLLERYRSRKDIIAIGETGIDLYWDKTFEKEQKKAFRQQIEWALQDDLPVVIHSRAAIDVTISIVTEMQNGSLRGVFHCFDQTLTHALKIIDIGFHLGFGGVITYKKNQDLREVISKLSLEHVIIETDAPYLPPIPHRGKRNESSYIPIIAHTIAQCKNTSVEKVAEETTNNAQKLFRL